MEIDKIGVVGAGQMGSGIAQVFAQAGFMVVMIDVYREQLDRGLAAVSRSLSRAVDKGLMKSEEREEAIARISTSLEMADLKESHLVVETVVEEVELKKKIFAQLDKLTGAETILATNTSSLSITDLAASTRRPDKVVGMHFFDPVPLTKLVEVVRGLATSTETLQIVKGVAERAGKTAVEVNDYPGFASYRVLLPMINEAISVLMEGVASVEAIDAVMRLGMSHPVGPLEYADGMGLDTCLSLLESLHRDLGDPKFQPCPLLRKMVAGGYLGRKSGRGFYRY